MTNALSNPTIEINDQPIYILPNSFSYVKGKGDTNVRAQSSGGGSSDIVITEDAETKVSKVKFSMAITDTNRDFIDQWQENRYNGGNTIRTSERVSEVPMSFRKMNITTDPEYSVGEGGSVEVEFMGSPA